MFKNALIKGTFILTFTGLITRCIGFFFRIFMSHNFGEEQMGLYQLIFPIYALCFSISAAGIETALSRNVAKKMARGNKREADLMLYQSLLLSVSISLLLVFLIHKFATHLSFHILGDLRCKELICTLSYALPFAAVHSCICGYYLGQKKTRIPALSQLIEQVSRVGVVLLVFYFYVSSGKFPSIWIAVLGLVIGESISSMFCARYFCVHTHTTFALSAIADKKRFREILSLAVPLTSNRLLTNLFQSIETISIPLFLQRYGYSGSDALSTYGVLTGMALQCIIFQTAITSSVSTMLLPTVAEIEAENNLVRLKLLIQKVFFFGFGLGTICGIFFLFFGSLIGMLLFDSSLAGDFLKTLAWICPFMYMNSTLISVINGLGKANISFLINLSGLALRIGGVWFGIPRFGMNGYLIGLLLSQLLVSLLCVTQLKLYIEKRALY